MTPLDPHLRQALRRQAAPDGFAERVLQRARQRPPRRPPRWLVAASILGLLLPAAVASQAYLARRRAQARLAQAELAHAQLLLALQITRQKLDLAFRHLQSPPE